MHSDIRYRYYKHRISVEDTQANRYDDVCRITGKYRNAPCIIFKGKMRRTTYIVKYKKKNVKHLNSFLR